MKLTEVTALCTVNDYIFQMMKVKIKSVLKSIYNDFESFEEGQIIIRSGNTLCIKQIGKNQCEFICLNPKLSHLFSFKPANNRKGVFTAQKVSQNIEIAHYNLKGERKCIALLLDNSFFAEVQKIELLVDEYDGNIVYGAARNKQGACIFLADMAKLKILAYGYMPHFQDVKVDSRQNLTISACWNNGSTNFIKFLRYTANQWQVQEQAYKRITIGLAIQHQILPCNRILLATKTHLYIFQDHNLLQTIEVDEESHVKQILKISHGLLAICEDQKIRVFVEDSDQVTFLKKGILKLELQENDSIFKAHLSNSNQEVLIRTHKNNLYSWKCQNLTLQTGHFDFMFNKVQSNCSSSHDGSISISTGRKYCILTGSRNTTLWSVQKNQFVLSSEFISSLQAEKKKSILCSAINPDGISFILAFEDKIRLYKVLLTKFKFFAQFPIKKCQKIVYSHGGQLVACKFGKGINSCIQIINLSRLIKIETLKIQAEVNQIVWNELDDQILVSTDQNTVQVYRVTENTRLHNIKFDQKIQYIRIDYKLRKLIVSAENKFHIIENGTIIDTIVPSIQHFDYVYPLYGIYLLTTKTGQLYISQSYRFQQYTSFCLFTKSPFKMICRNSYIIAYSSFQNVMILHCQRSNHFKNKLTDDIVMVQRDQVIGFFEKVKKIESEYQVLISATQIKLQEQKNKYQNSLQKFKEQFSNQMKFLNSNFTGISTAKLKQQKEHEKVFEKVENQQLKYVHDIEKMYQRKCAILQQKFLDLQQKNLEQKNKYEGIISELQTRYHRDVSNIRANYQKNYDQQCQRAQKEQAKILQYKQKMQFKVLDMQQENQKAIGQIQEHKDNKIQQLMNHNHALEIQVRNVKSNFEIKLQAYEKLKDQFEFQQKKYKKLNQHYQESLNRIKLLENGIAQKNQMLEEKNQFITQLDQQISGLQKAKYVMSFRTTEIRKEFQPKQNLIDRLKSELHKIDQQYRQQKSKNFELNQKNEKFTKISQVLKKQNVDTKMALKLKQRLFDQLCSQLFMIVNTVDPKDWNERIIKIYKNFIKQDKFKARQVKKKDQSAEELNRHLMHVEQSLNQVSSGNDKILRGKQKDITRRMRQNSELLYQINMMKKKQKELLKSNNQLTINNDRLQKELHQVYKSTKRESTRSQTANTGMTRRVAASRDALYSRQKSMLIDGIDWSKQAGMKQMQRQKSRIGSAHKTLMFKDAKRQKSAKFFDIAKELQTARNTIKIQDQMIQQLNHRLFTGEEGN